MRPPAAPGTSDIDHCRARDFVPAHNRKTLDRLRSETERLLPSNALAQLDVDLGTDERLQLRAQ